MSAKITIMYFAQLMDEAKVDRQEFEVNGENLREIYVRLSDTYHFSLKPENLRVALNQEFSSWDTIPIAGDEVAFIPPVAGG